ncbi:MAG: ParB N-terminal domain-containing protein [Anaerolineales bacterium]
MPILEAGALDLRFANLDALRLHEEDDPYRVRRLQRALAEDGVQRNPVIVSEHAHHLIVLDGATRTSALRELGYRDVLVQVVDYHSDQIELGVWHHVIVGMTANRLLAELADVEALSIEPADPASIRRMLADREIVGCIIMRNGQEFAVLAEGDINSQATSLCQLVAVYRGKARVHRTTTVELPALTEEYPDLAAVVAFPQYEADEIVQIAQEGDKVPMGITRHVIAGRALGVGVPLTMLTDEQSLQEKNDWLRGFIRQRLHANKIRLYQEPVFLFDE